MNTNTNLAKAKKRAYIPSTLRDGWVYTPTYKYINKQYGAVRSSDLEHWEDVSDKISFPTGARHGSVIEVPAAEFLQNFKAFLPPD